MEILQSKILNRKEILYFSIISFLVLILQLLLVTSFPNLAILIIVFLILSLFTVIWLLSYVKDLFISLLILNFLPLLILDNNLHYIFYLEIISFLPFFIFLILALSKYLSREKKFTLHIGYIQLPIIILVIYFGINSLYSLTKDRQLFVIIVEYFHFCLYLSIIPIVYIFKNREKYYKVLKFLLVISVLISLEYLFFNIIYFNERFVTFQSGFIPLASGVVFAYTLVKKRVINKLSSIIILLILISGTVITLTRTLWATTFLVLLFTFVIYLKSQNKITISKIILLLIILLVPISVLKDTGAQLKNKVALNQTTESRAKSLSNPTEDVSFLMRVELSYYAFNRFLEKPILGNGIGDYLKYKIFKVNSEPNYFIDNTWFYLLWKGGIIGFILFLWAYIRFFKASYFIIKNTDDLNTRIISIGLLAGFIGLSILALLSPLLIKYKTNLLIAFLFAYVEFERLKILNLVNDNTNSEFIN